MPSKHIIALLLLALLASGCASTHTRSSNTQADKQDVTPFSAQGWGGTDCQQLINDITPTEVGFEQAVQNIRLYQSWASGFVSGVNYENRHAYDVSGDTSPETTFVWLKDYCSENPDVAVPLALHKLLATWEQEGKIQARSE